MRLTDLPTQVVKELSVNSGTLIILLLWESSQYSQSNPVLSLVLLGMYAILDQANSRFYMIWLEHKLKEEKNDRR